MANDLPVSQLPPVFTPMLASMETEPFDSDEYWFEVKWDGVRALVFCESGSTRLVSRSGRDMTHQYPEFSDLHRKIRLDNAVFDGEIIALDENAKPSFELLQRRINLSRSTDISRGVTSVQLDLVLFDLVFADGRWTGAEPLARRLDRLSSSIEFEERILRSEPVPGHGIALFEAAKARGLEGVVAKRVLSPYLPGKRTKDWLKIKVVHSVDCVIGGWTPGLGSRGHSLGALLAGVYEGRDLVYIGSVGTGFTDKTLNVVKKRLEALEASSCPFKSKPNLKGARWTRPEQVCEVEYREFTGGKKLRAPAFKGLRFDKPPQHCDLSQFSPH
ncbi:MAG: non-homologous end-joining DNA ligase [Actinomycetota bacterium]